MGFWETVGNVASGGLYTAGKNIKEGNVGTGLTSGLTAGWAGPNGVIPVANGQSDGAAQRPTSTYTPPETPFWEDPKYGGWNPADNMGTADPQLAADARWYQEYYQTQVDQYNAAQNWEGDGAAPRYTDPTAAYNEALAKWDAAYNSRLNAGQPSGPVPYGGAQAPGDLITIPTDNEGNLLLNNEAINEAAGMANPKTPTESFYGSSVAQGYMSRPTQSAAGMFDVDAISNAARATVAGTGQGRDAAAGAYGAYTDNGQFSGPGVSNNAQLAYNAFGMPELSANLDPYYDNQRRKVEEQIKESMLSRGMFGSSVSMDLSREALTDLGARQAMDEAQYGLDRAGVMTDAQRARTEGARAADLSSQAAAENERQWMDTLTGNALEADRVGLDQAGALTDIGSMRIDAASAADIAENARLRYGLDAADAATLAARLQSDSEFAQQFMLWEAMQKLSGEWYDRIVGGERELMMRGTEAGLAADVNLAHVNTGNMERAGELYEDVVSKIGPSAGAFAKGWATPPPQPPKV